MFLGFRDRFELWCSCFCGFRVSVVGWVWWFLVLMLFCVVNGVTFSLSIGLVSFHRHFFWVVWNLCLVVFFCFLVFLFVVMIWFCLCWFGNGDFWFFGDGLISFVEIWLMFLKLFLIGLIFVESRFFVHFFFLVGIVFWKFFFWFFFFCLLCWSGICVLNGWIWNFLNYNFFRMLVSCPLLFRRFYSVHGCFHV